MSSFLFRTFDMAADSFEDEEDYDDDDDDEEEKDVEEIKKWILPSLLQRGISSTPDSSTTPGHETLFKDSLIEPIFQRRWACFKHQTS